MNDITKTLMQEFDIKNVMAAPKIQKVVLNIGLKEAAHDKGVLEKTENWLTAITGQKPKTTHVKTSIANFKVREGDPVGLTVTLRGAKMQDFITRLTQIVLPRVRDFHGVSATAFDGVGNYNLGISEQIVFPEVDYGKIDRIRGLQITFVISNSNPKISKRMLELVGVPFKK